MTWHYTGFGAHGNSCESVRDLRRCACSLPELGPTPLCFRGPGSARARVGLHPGLRQLMAPFGLSPVVALVYVDMFMKIIFGGIRALMLTRGTHGPY